MDLVPYEDFAKLDIRIVRIASAEPIPGKTRIMRGVIDTGSDKIDVIIGGAQYYSPEEMAGRQAVAILNLEPKSIAGITSSAMLLAADLDGRPFWLKADDDAPPGSKIS